jgi:predicted AAA+ superfamily ATPase
LRIKTSPKVRFVDPSISAAITRLNPEKIKKNLRYFGFLFESLVIRDLLTYVSCSDSKIYQFNFDDSSEIDVIVENSDGE